MTDDLVKRLREWAKFGYGNGPAKIMDEAADHIEKLEAELVRTFNSMMGDAKHIEKLEAALRKISREQTLWGAMRKAQHALGEFDRKAFEDKPVSDSEARIVINKARKALEGKDE